MDEIDKAVDNAQDAYESARKSPLDHGFAMVKGIDGRTKLARQCSEHTAIDVESDDYHGTTVHIDGLTRYLSAQAHGYQAFIDSLESSGFDVDGWHVFTHGH